MLRTLLFAAVAGLGLSLFPATPASAQDFVVDGGPAYVAYRPYARPYYNYYAPQYTYRYPAYSYPGTTVYSGNYYYDPYSGYSTAPYTTYYGPTYYGPRVGVSVGPLGRVRYW